MAGLREKLQTRLNGDQAQRGRSQWVTLALLLGLPLAIVLLLLGLGSPPETLARHGLLVLPLLIVLAGELSSPAAALIVGAACVLLGLVLPLTFQALKDYTVTAPAALAGVTGLTWLTAHRLHHTLSRLEVQRAQSATREKALTDQIEAQTAGLTALRQDREALLMMAQTPATPALPVWEGVLVLPFAGPLNEQRARLVRRTLLEAIETHHAHTAILDVTGLSEVTEEVVEWLASMTRAVGLIGCRAIVVGVRPPLAQRMAELKADLGDVVMHRNLQAGVEYALSTTTPEVASG